MILWRWKNLQVFSSLVTVSILLSFIHSRSVLKKIFKNEEAEDGDSSSSDADSDMSFIQGFLSGDLALGDGQLDLNLPVTIGARQKPALQTHDEDNERGLAPYPSSEDHDQNNDVKIIKASARANYHSRSKDDGNLPGPSKSANGQTSSGQQWQSI